MKAKACARCRQSKLRCDSDVTAPGPCSRCQLVNVACVVDYNFRRVSKSTRLMELEAEVAYLRKVSRLNSNPTSAAVSASTTATASAPTAPLLTGQSQAQAQTTLPPACVPVQGSLTWQNLPYHQSPLPQPPGPDSDLDPQERSLAGVRLSSAQINQSFQTFFVQCHVWLPFSISKSPEHVYSKCPLLFWVVCAASSSASTMLELQPGIQAMIGQVVVNPPRSIEVVQALLILCMWPFPFYSTLGDPSFVYCGIATQIGYQIGLHRPTLSHEYSSKKEVLEVEERVRKTTWIACYVVSQTQTARLGLPHGIHADYTFLQTLDSPELSDSTLGALGRISRLTAQFTSTIGANAQNITGLSDCSWRIDLVRLFKGELESLERTQVPQTCEVVMISFLTSRLQLLSFALHDDIPCGPDVIELIYQAEIDAAAIILTASEKNLSRCPFNVTRSVLYAALTLIKIVASCHARQPRVIFDHIMLASRTLSTAIKVPDDHAQRWTRHLQQLVTLKDYKRTPSIRSRMAASLVYDTIRVMKEHLDMPGTENLPSTAPDHEIPRWMNAETAAGLLDLDGLNWDDLGEIL